MKKCPECGKEYSDETKFCQVDGTELEEKIELKKCPSCNAENPETAKFCNECGEKFISIIYRCSNKTCGKIYEVYNSENCFCSRCGGKIEEYQEQTFQTENNSLKEQIKVLENKIEELNNHNNSLKKSNENQKNELGNEISKLQVQLEEAKTKISSQENTISQITDEKESLQQKLHSTETEFSKIEAELKKYKDKEEQELLKKQQEEEQQKRLEEKRNKDFVLLDKYQKPFYICKYQVTQELYEKVMGENPSHFEGKDLPVEEVSWYDAIYFCNKLSIEKGLEPVYTVDGNADVFKWGYKPHDRYEIKGGIKQNTKANGYRLPTEDEWEYAAKGGENYKYAGSNNLDEVGWYNFNSGGRTHQVGQKKPNGYGLYDMSGNVWEWCWDLYGGSCCVLRGGSWYYSGSSCAVSFRNGHNPYSCSMYYGFRLVRSSSN